MLLKLLDQVNRFVNGNSSKRELESWLLSNMQTILDSREDKAIRLANEIDTGLIELREGIIDEVAFYVFLEGVIGAAATLHLAYSEIPPTVSNTSTGSVPFLDQWG